MIVVIQRVKSASINVASREIASIAQGIVALCAFEPHDTHACIEKMIQKILQYRIFSDQADKMNLSLRDIHGDLLLVPQFTLAADTNTGRRPSFTSAAPPALGEQLFQHALRYAKAEYDRIQCGEFGADMQVCLINDGPVTFIFDSNNQVARKRVNNA